MTRDARSRGLPYIFSTLPAWMSRLPLQRYGAPDEVAGAIAYLCSADAAYVTGQTLSVDGGFSVAGIMMRDPWRPDTAE